MAVTKIKKQNTVTPIYDARVPEIEAAGKVLKTVSEDDKIVPAWGDFPTELPALPEDASEKTYVLKAVNGVLSWVEETAAEA